jgi:hypothetical protein
MPKVAEFPVGEDDVPPPSPELVALGVQLVACFRATERLERGEVKPRNFRRAFNEEMERAWTQTERSVGIIRFRDARYDREQAKAIRQARAWYDKLLMAMDATSI